jgi:uncharacterized protein YutE (UPF0331/DUF86 family)
VERQSGIIDEAVNEFEKLTNISLSDSRQIVGFRNRLIHAYDNADSAIVRAIIKRHLFPLEEEVKRLLLIKGSCAGGNSGNLLKPLTITL